MLDADKYKLRPAGRHVLTIGKDLIQDRYAAIVELVKNAYDADSPNVKIEFKANSARTSYSISIVDQGHGMTRSTVINKWLVPSTNDKLGRVKSPNGRTMQGRKGIGRYASSILGTDLLLETVTEDGEKTSVYLVWSDFESAEFLDQVEISVRSERVNSTSGTRLTMTGDAAGLAEWDQIQLEKLKFELKKLTSQRSVTAQEKNEHNFQIEITTENFFEGDSHFSTEIIEPYEIIELFDYRIEGIISADGRGHLTYYCNRSSKLVKEEIDFYFGSSTRCGAILFDIRVFDREKEAIDSLIGKGLKDDYGNYVGKLYARTLLNEFNGVSVYRNGFRIRPLGDADFDWLRLNQRRVQNPSMKIGNNQVIGFVEIESEESSGLIEKSARDGLAENAAFNKLKEITTSVIGKLEERRFDYRKKIGLGRPATKVEAQLQRLFEFDDLKKVVRLKLSKHGLPAAETNAIIDAISKEEQDKNKIADEIRQAVAVYQGQATLGKIINVILHEGRRPLNYFKNQIPNLKYWYDSYSASHDPINLEHYMPIAEGIKQNAEIFVRLFGRLDPLAAGKRSQKKQLLLKATISDALKLFTNEIEEAQITLTITGPDDFKFLSWQQDLYAIFANLADNSIYWINERNSPAREINIFIETDGEHLNYIDYRDSGPGIEPLFIENQIIFEPQFSTKIDGTGLGLAIAGEAAARNGLELTAFQSDKGAYFRLQPRTENIDDQL